MIQRLRFEYDHEKVAAAMGRLAAAMGRLAAAMGESIANIRAAFEPAIKAMQDAERLPTPPPEDPRERALWAKQRRTT